METNYEIPRPKLQCGKVVEISEIHPWVSAVRYEDGFIEIYYGDEEIGDARTAVKVGLALVELGVAYRD